MIDSRHLYHMYQAWSSGQEDAVRDWFHFVEWAARLNNTSGDAVMRVLQTTYWFKKPKELK